MAKIVDPDQLNQSTQGTAGTPDGEVFIDTSTKTIELIVFGNLDDTNPGRTSGVTFQAVYSFLKEEWKDDTALNKFRFPIKAFTKFEFQWINSWAPLNQQTRDLLRDSGWIESVGAEAGDQWAGIITLGTFDNVADQAYYQQVAGLSQTTSTFDKSGEVNEAILIFDADGNDYTDYLKTYLREQGKLYDSGNLIVDQDLSLLEPTLYRIPLSNANDIKITASDATIDSTTPYTGMSISYLQGSGFTTWANTTLYPAGAVVLDPIRQSGGSSNGTWWFTVAGGTSSGTGTADDVGVTWESYAGERQIGTEWYAYNRIVDGNSGTAEEIYEYTQRQGRQTGNINDDLVGNPNQDGFGTVNGNIAPVFMSFLGDTLQTAPGVYIDSFDVNDQNRIEFFDITVDGGGLDSEFVPVTSTSRTFPFVAAGNILFSDNLVSEPDADTLYNMYFSNVRSQTGTDLAISGASGSSATLDSTTTDLSNIANNDYFRLSGFATSGNNGLMQSTSNMSATGGTFSRVDGGTLSNETAGPSVTVAEKPFDSPDAIIVQNTTPTNIGGQITAASIAFDFDYDNNVQGGRDSGTDAPVTIVAQGLNGAEWVEASFTISRTTGLSFPVNANDERNYSNPV